MVIVRISYLIELSMGYLNLRTFGNIENLFELSDFECSKFLTSFLQVS